MKRQANPQLSSPGEFALAQYEQRWLAQIMGHDLLDTTKPFIQGTRHDLQRAVETIAWTENWKGKSATGPTLWKNASHFQ